MVRQSCRIGGKPPFRTADSFRRPRAYGMGNGQLVQSAAAYALPPVGRSVPAHEPAARGQASEGRHGMAHQGPALVLFWLA
jgi:hypothetical protein